MSVERLKLDKIKLDNTTIKKILISALLVVALVIQFSFLSYLIRALTPDSERNDKNVIMSYTSKGNLNYRVYLKPNQFISAPYLEAGEAYILDLIDHVQITSLYNFSSTAKTNVTGTNKLVARLKVYYKESTDTNNNPEVLKKERTLDQKVMSFNENAYSSVNTYNLNLGEYLTILKEFQEQVKIAVDGYLEVSAETDFSGTVGGASYNNSYANVLKIPLSESVIKIEQESSEDETSKVFESDLVKTNKVVMAFIIIANVVVFAIICVLLRQLFMFTNKTEYERVLGKLLRTYDDIIVNTTSILDVSRYKLIEIEEFKEILNLSRELLLPIMNYEVEKGKETWFYVVRDDILYRYVVSSEKLEADKNEKIKEKKKRKTNNN